jgi:hypothetical protein
LWDKTVKPVGTAAITPIAPVQQHIFYLG